MPNLSWTVFVLVKEKYIKNKIKQRQKKCWALCLDSVKNVPILLLVVFHNWCEILSDVCASVFFLMTWAYEELKCQFLLFSGIKMTFIMSLHSERSPGSDKKEQHSSKCFLEARMSCTLWSLKVGSTCLLWKRVVTCRKPGGLWEHQLYSEHCSTSFDLEEDVRILK